MKSITRELLLPLFQFAAVFVLSVAGATADSTDSSGGLSTRELQEALQAAAKLAAHQPFPDVGCHPMVKNAEKNGAADQNWTSLRTGKNDSQQIVQDDLRGPCKTVKITCIPEDGWRRDSEAACSRNECRLIFKSPTCLLLGWRDGDIVDVQDAIDRIRRNEYRNIEEMVRACGGVHELCHATHDPRTMERCADERECYTVQADCLHGFLDRLCQGSYPSRICIELKVQQCAAIAASALQWCRCDNSLPPKTPCPNCVGVCKSTFQNCLYAIRPEGDPIWTDSEEVRNMIDQSCEAQGKGYCEGID